MSDNQPPEAQKPEADESGPGALTLGQRFRQPQTLISFLFAVVIIVFLVLRLDIDPGDVWNEIRNANPWLFLSGLIVYYGGFLLRVFRWRWMLTRAGLTPQHDVYLPGNNGLLKIMLLAWFANCVVPAKLGDVYRGFLLKQRSGAPFTTTMGTIAAERLIDLVVLVVLLVSSGVVVFGRHFPSGASTVLTYGGATVLAGVLAVVVAWLFRDSVLRRMPARFTGHFERLQQGFFVNLKSPWRSVLISIVVWSAEGFRFFFVAWSLGSVLPMSTALFIALLSSMATVSPLSPAGLGVVEALVISILPLVGVTGDSAAAIAILDRVISYMSLIVVGLPLYVIHMRGDVAGARRLPTSPT
ncbi:lysylphosphatidylglycerol synthase transmembrane domain-containing protein [soil metagenome]